MPKFLVRSTRCTLKFITQAKRATLQRVITEYAVVVNQFIEMFWSDGIPAKKDLTASVYSKATSWLSPTMKQIASREAVDMITASKERDGDDAVMPVHKAKKMQLTQQVVKLGDAVTAEFGHRVHAARRVRGGTENQNSHTLTRCLKTGVQSTVRRELYSPLDGSASLHISKMQTMWLHLSGQSEWRGLLVPGV